MRWVAAALALLTCIYALQGCSVPFYLQAARGQLQLLRAREPIAEVIADPATPEQTRVALSSVEAVRQFAVNELGLPDNGSYSTYADLERDYVVWNVVAAPPFSTTPEQWCFPFAGCVSYRGFFDRERALGFQRRLDEQGLDTWSGGSDAYSTLGWFADPVLNTMIDSGAVGITAILIHELAHQRIYVRGDSELSEAFASVIEEYGTRTWLTRIGDTQGLMQYQNRLRERAAFAQLVAQQQERLAGIYAQPLEESQMRERKAAAFAALQADYAAARERDDLSSGYDAWFAQDLNNATLAAVATYRAMVPPLRARLQAVGLQQFYTDIEALEDAEFDARRATIDSWRP